MNHFCTFYVIKRELWDYFYFDSVFTYFFKGTYQCEEIVVTIFYMSLKVHPQDKMLLRLKICKGSGFQEQFSLVVPHGGCSRIYVCIYLFGIR